MSVTLDLVRQAIQQRKQVVAVYQGHRRVLCPHVVGYKNGHEQALFYQCGGTSSSGLGPMGSKENWRCIPLAMMSDVTIQDGEWFTCTQHTQRQTCVDHVVAEVDY